MTLASERPRGNWLCAKLLRARNFFQRGPQQACQWESLAHTGSYQQHAHNLAHATFLSLERHRNLTPPASLFSIEQSRSSALSFFAYPTARDFPLAQLIACSPRLIYTLATRLDGNVAITTLLRLLSVKLSATRPQGARLFLPILGVVLTFAPLPPVAVTTSNPRNYLLSSSGQWRTASSFLCIEPRDQIV